MAGPERDGAHADAQHVAEPAQHQLRAGGQQPARRRMLDRGHLHVGQIQHAVARVQQPEPGRLVLAGQQLHPAQPPVIDIVGLDRLDEARIGRDATAQDRHAAGQHQQAPRQRHRRHQQMPLGKAQAMPGPQDRAALDHAVLVRRDPADLRHQLQERQRSRKAAGLEQRIAVEHHHRRIGRRPAAADRPERAGHAVALADGRAPDEHQPDLRRRRHPKEQMLDQALVGQLDERGDDRHRTAVADRFRDRCLIDAHRGLGADAKAADQDVDVRRQRVLARACSPRAAAWESGGADRSASGRNAPCPSCSARPRARRR